MDSENGQSEGGDFPVGKRIWYIVSGKIPNEISRRNSKREFVYNIKGESLMRQFAIRFALVVAVVVCCHKVSVGQCPAGFKHADKPLYGEGSWGSNFYGLREVLLPPGEKIDTSYHQPSISAVANGKSDARSPLVASQVPAGIFIIPSGDDSANHGWAVHSPVLSAGVADPSTNIVSQWKFGMQLYCTTGSGEIDRTTGGCNVKVEVCYKPLSTATKNGQTKNQQ